MLYVNFDVETTGHDPASHAMIQFGAVIHHQDGWEEKSAWTTAISVPSNRGWDADTLMWWLTEVGEGQLARVLEAGRPPSAAVRGIFTWLLSQVGDEEVAFVANPIAYDFSFLSRYMEEFVGNEWRVWAREKHAGLGGVDIPTLAMAAMSRHAGKHVPYALARRRYWPKAWVSGDLKYTHDALDDARSQAYSFIQIMKELAQ